MTDLTDPTCSDSVVNQADVIRCTTISTIAVRSLGTQVVIALLQTPNGLSLKILEMTPKLSFLPRNAEDASEALIKQQEVLQKLREKTTPVEELLRQVEGNVTTSNAETYAAMTDSVSVAWLGLNKSLESKQELLQGAKDFHGHRSTCLSYFSNLYLDKKEVLFTYRYAVEEGRRLITKLSTMVADEPESACYSINMVNGWMDELQQNLMLWKRGIKQLRTQSDESKTLEIFENEIERIVRKINAKEGVLSEHRIQLLHIASKIEASSLPHGKSSPLQQKVYNLVEQVTTIMELEVETQQFLDSCKDQGDPQLKNSWNKNVELLRQSQSLRYKIDACLRDKWEFIMQNGANRSLFLQKDSDLKLMQTKIEEATEKLKNTIFEEMENEIQNYEQEWKNLTFTENPQNFSDNLNLSIQKLIELEELIGADELTSKFKLRCEMLKQKSQDATAIAERVDTFMKQHNKLDEKSFVGVYKQKLKELECFFVPSNHPMMEKLLKRIAIGENYDKLVVKPLQYSENEIIEILNQDSELDIKSALEKVFLKRLDQEKQQFELEMEANLEVEAQLEEHIASKERLEEIEKERKRQEGEEVQRQQKEELTRQKAEDLLLQYEEEFNQYREAEVQKQLYEEELKRQREAELKKQVYEEELKRQREAELQKKLYEEELKRQREAELQQQLYEEELKRQREAELQKQLYEEESKRQREAELQKQLYEEELKRQREAELQKQLYEEELKRQREAELQKQLYEEELQRQREAELHKQLYEEELKRQREAELQKQLYEEQQRERDAELQRQKYEEELKRQRDAEQQRQQQEELKRLEIEELQRKHYEQHLKQQEAEELQRQQYEEQLKRQHEEEMQRQNYIEELKKQEAQKLQFQEELRRKEYEYFLKVEEEYEQQRQYYYENLMEAEFQKEKRPFELDQKIPKPQAENSIETEPFSVEVTSERDGVGESTIWCKNNSICQAELVEYQKIKEFGDIQFVEELQAKRNASDQKQKIDELMTILDFPLPENLETTINDLRDFAKLEEIVEKMENPPLYLVEKMYEKKDKIIKCSRLYELAERCENQWLLTEIEQLERELFGTTYISEQIYNASATSLSKATVEYEVQPVEVAVTHEDTHRYSADENLLAMLDTEVETIFEQAEAKFLSHNETQTEIAEKQPEPILLIMSEPAKVLSSAETQTKSESVKQQHSSSSQTELEQVDVPSSNQTQVDDFPDKEAIVLIQQEPAKLALDNQTQTPVPKLTENRKYEIFEETEEQIMESNEYTGIMHHVNAEKVISQKECDTQTHEPSPKLLQNASSQTQLIKETNTPFDRTMETYNVLPGRKLSIKEKIAAWNQQTERSEVECENYICNEFKQLDQTKEFVQAQILKPDEKTTTEKNNLDDNFPKIKEYKKLFEESHKPYVADVKPEPSAFVTMPNVGRFKELFEQEQQNSNLHLLKSEEVENDVSIISGRRSVTDYKKLFESNQPCVKEIRSEKKYNFETNSYINTYTEEIKSPGPQSPKFQGRMFDGNPEAFYEYDSYKISSPRPESSLSFEMWPSKFVPARFTESDYESDYDAFKINEPIWKPSSGNKRPISAIQLGQETFVPDVDSTIRPRSSTLWKPIPPPKPTTKKISKPIPTVPTTTETNVQLIPRSNPTKFCKSPATITSEHISLEYDEPVSSSEVKHKELSSIITKTEECKFLLKPVKSPELDDLHVIRRVPSPNVNYYVSVTTPPINLPLDTRDVVKESKIYTKETYYEEKTGRELGSIEESYTGLSPTYSRPETPAERPKSTNEFNESHWMQKTISEETNVRPRSAEYRSIYVSEGSGRPKSSEMYHEIQVENVARKSVKELIHQIQMSKE